MNTTNEDEDAADFDELDFVKDIDLTVSDFTKLIQNSLEASKCHWAHQNNQVLPWTKL